MNAAELLKERRIAAGMTKADLARAVGVTKSTVGHWENGSVPRQDHQPKLNELFGLTDEVWLEAARQRAARLAAKEEALRAVRAAMKAAA